MIRRTQVSATGAAGGAGAATATADSTVFVRGVVLAVYLAYLDSPPAGTTDVTIKEANNSPAVSVLTVANAATDGWFFPRASAVSQTNAAITDSHAGIPVDDHLEVTIAQANNSDGVTATIVWEDGR